MSVRKVRIDNVSTEVPGAAVRPPYVLLIPADFAESCGFEAGYSVELVAEKDIQAYDKADDSDFGPENIGGFVVRF